ncbi:ABC transporter permease [Streptococcus didelphis]|uniref:ABC transporter permease n=1 Tax=Streptococcus didelphis TaxID=102886 RepID=A0ABY9LH75_9STRE|nr:hypothetical protein [Streptococcus didelphis]WMB28220.1 ABC transporter permease [Streptococcus didelphis]WMB30129.1 ABC transporter permease [Streptococcus didelphis]
MFGKLLKYEFKSIGKWYFALNVGIVAIAAILSFTIKMMILKSPTDDELSWTVQLLPLTLMLIFGVLIAGSLLATLLIIINRFNKNIFGREGYLTMTLPVSEHLLILSKLLSSFICSIFNLIILGLATAILILPQVTSSQLRVITTEAWKFISQHVDNILFVTAFLIFSTLSSILMIYLAISIGQLFSNRRGLKAFVAYAIISIVLNIAFSQFNTNVLNLQDNTLTAANMNRYFSVTLCESLFQIILFYFSTHFIIKNKLNLQ